MASSLDLLSKNLVGTNGMMCKRCEKCEKCEKCESEAELIHIDENYVTHGMCGKCGGDSHHKLMIEPIFDNLRVGHMNEQFRLLFRK